MIPPSKLLDGNRQRWTAFTIRCKSNETLTEAVGTPAVFPEFQRQNSEHSKGLHMTYDPNRPRVARESYGISGTWIAGVAALLVVLGVLIFASRDDRTASTTPPSTTGQTQKTPAPVPNPTTPKAQ